MAKPIDEMSREDMIGEIRFLRARRDELLNSNSSYQEYARNEHKKRKEAEARLENFSENFADIRQNLAEAYAALSADGRGDIARGRSLYTMSIR